MTTAMLDDWFYYELCEWLSWEVAW